MLHILFKSANTPKLIAAALVLMLGLVYPFSAHAHKKKKADTAAAPQAGPRKFPFDPTKLVWPAARWTVTAGKV